MVKVMSKASGTAEAESSLSWPCSVVELLTELSSQQSHGNPTSICQLRETGINAALVLDRNAFMLT